MSSLLLEFSAAGVAALYWILSGLIVLTIIVAFLFLQTLPKDENQIDRATGMKQFMAVLKFPFQDTRAMVLTPMPLAYGFGLVFASLVPSSSSSTSSFSSPLSISTLVSYIRSRKIIKFV
jgi:hypothetical protein